MDDIGNIVYLVVLVLSFVFGIWQKANKAKQASSRPPVEADDYTEVYAPMEEVEEPKEPQVRQVMDREMFDQARAMEGAAAVKLREMELKAKSVRDEASADRKRRRRAMQVRDAADLKEREEREGQEDAYLSDFDARKAVIYSEILNPPYL
ncbi:MAG: hypothetical protein HQ500_09780 [Flavobacteriales bacterium]|nr:hypothetical protein [Flavobacteriales bacterium]